MKDQALERIWKSREAIAKRCGFDSRKLVKFYQQRQKGREENRPIAPERDSAGAAAR